MRHILSFADIHTPKHAVQLLQQPAPSLCCERCQQQQVLGCDCACVAVQAELEQAGDAAEVARLEAQVMELMAESEALAEEALTKDEEIEALEGRLEAADKALAAAQQARAPHYTVSARTLRLAWHIPYTHDVSCVSQDTPGLQQKFCNRGYVRGSRSAWSRIASSPAVHSFFPPCCRFVSPMRVGSMTANSSC